MLATASRIADFLTRQTAVRVVTHIDADGITSGAIASLALDRAGIPYEVEFVKQLDEEKVRDLQTVQEVLWFTDLGSAKLDAFDPLRTVVTDHHIPQSGNDPTAASPPMTAGPSVLTPTSGHAPPKPTPSRGQMSLLDFSSSPSTQSPPSPPSIPSSSPPTTISVPTPPSSHPFPLSSSAPTPSPLPTTTTSTTTPTPPSSSSPLPTTPSPPSASSPSSPPVTAREEYPGVHHPYHLNPHLFGHDGSMEISGAGLTFLVARAMDPENVDLSALAIVGAVGDLQDSANCRLVGLNRDILGDGIEHGVVETDTDVRYFGRETRPLHKLLQYSSDPIVPMVSGSEEGALEFLMGSGIELKEGDSFRSWIHLARDEKRTIVSGMVRLALTMGLDPADIRRMTGEVYMLPQNELGTPLHDAKEFATMLNACGKNLHPEVGFQVCRGDREEYLQRAYALLQGHRRNLANYIQLVERDLGITQSDVLQYFDAGTEIPENLVGIVAGMVLNSGGSDLAKVMVGLARAENGYKISARTTRMMVNRGVDLAEALRYASGQVGGEGGGHNIAAGAFIPEEKVREFLSIFEERLKEQITG